MQSACVVLSSVACPTLHYFSTLSHKLPDFLGGKVIEYKICVMIFCTTFFFPTYFRGEKNPQKSNLTKIRQVGVQMFHADGGTDMTKLMVPYRNFANASKTIRFFFLLVFFFLHG